MTRTPVPPEGELLLGLASEREDPAARARTEGALRQTLDWDLLLHLCYHGGKSRWSRLKWVCDLDRLVRVCPLDWREIETRAVACGCWRMVRLGLLLAREHLGAPIPPGLLDGPRGDKQLRVLAAHAAACWCSFEPVPHRLRDLFWPLRLPDRLSRRLLGLARVLVVPSAEDRRGLALPPQLAFLHYLWRPLRLGCKYTVGRMVTQELPALPAEPPVPEVRELSADSTVARCGGFSACRVDGALVIVNLAEARSFVLDEVAARVWEHLTEPSRVSALCQLVSGARSEPEVIAFLRCLAQEGAIRITAPPMVPIGR